MRHGLFFFLYSLAIHYSAFAQKDYKVTIGAAYEYIDKCVVAGFLGNSTDGYVQLSIRYKEKLALEKFDASLNLMTAETKDLSKLPYDMATEGFFEWKGKGVWLYNTFDKKATIAKLFYQEFNVKTGKFVGEPKLLIEVVGNLYGRAAAGVEVGSTIIFKDRFKMSLSEDSSQLIFLGEHREVRSKSNPDPLSTYEMWSFDSNFKLVSNIKWEKGVSSTSDFDVYSVKPLTNGDLVVVGRVIEGDPKSRKSSNTYRYVRLNYNGETVQKVSFTMEDKEAHASGVKVHSNGVMIFSGTYIKYTSDDKSKINTEGTFAVKVTPEQGNGVSEFVYNPLPASIKSDYAKRWKDNLEESLYFEDRAVLPNGTAMLCMEVRHKTAVTTSNATYTTHYNEDIIVQAISPADGPLWTRVIPKAQKFNEQYSFRDLRTKIGVAMVNSGDKVYLIYFDNPANRDIQQGSIPEEHEMNKKDSEGCLVVVSIDQAGKVVRTIVEQGEKLEGIVRLHNIKVVAPGVFYFRVEANRMCKVGLISVN